MKEYLVTKINLLLNPDDGDAKELMTDICNYFIELNKPKTFNPRADNNIIVNGDKQFEAIIISLQEGGVNTENISVFEFYGRIEYFERKYEKMKSYGSNK